MDAVTTHRAKLERIAIGSSVSKLKKVYDAAQETVLARIRKATKTGKSATFGIHQSRIVLVQLKQGQALMAKRMTGDMKPLSKDAQELALKGLAEDVTKLHKHFTGAEISLPIEEASIFADVIEGREASLLAMHAESMNRYGANIVGKVQKQLALNLLQGDSPGDVYEAVADTIGGEWWQGERIVRTEMAYAFNATHADGIEESAKELPELRQRWEEHCDDTGHPLDDRVGVDSIAMHGQVTDPGDEFTMPATAPFPDAKGNTEVSPSLVGLSWDFPPNRPNDRAVLSPWMEDWDIPGWEYKGGKRVWLVR
jgi:hypothetical protein